MNVLVPAVPQAEAAALLRFSVRTWTDRAMSPSPAASRDAMGVLAVVLPMLLLFPVAAAFSFAAVIIGFRWDFFLVSLPFGADLPAWLLWSVTAVFVVAGRASWARWSAAVGVAAYAAAMNGLHEHHNFLMFGNAIAWLGVQIAALLALASPSRVQRGRQLIPSWCLAGIGAASAGFSVLLVFLDQFRPPFINSPALLAGVAVLAWRRCSARSGGLSCRAEPP